MTAPMTTLWRSSSRPSSSCTTDRAVLVEHDPVAVERLHGAQFVVPHDAIVLGLDLRLLERLARRAADVERAHRQLRARLADGLRGDDADRFAQLHELPGRQVAAVAMRADAAPAFAGEHRANLDALDADLLDRRGACLVDLLIRLDDFLLRHRIDDRLAATRPTMRVASSTTSSSPS